MRIAGIATIAAVLLLFGAFVLTAITDTPTEAFDIERIGPFGGEVRSLLIDNRDSSNVYLGTTNGRIYKSADRGVTWNRLFPGISRGQYVIDTLVQHPKEPEHIYAGAWDIRSNGGGLFESRDGGISWHEIRLPQSSPAVRDLSISIIQPKSMLAGTLDAAFLSRDGGQTWNALGGSDPEFRRIESVAFDPSDPANLYLGTWRLAYRSGDGGKSWARVQNGMLFDSDVFCISPDPRRPQVVYASTCSGIYRSSDGARSWTRLKVLPNGYGVRAHLVYIDPTDSNCIYGGTTEGLFASDDAGQSWRRLTSSNVIVNAIQVDPSDAKRILIGTESQGIMRSEDRGEHWIGSNSGFIHRQISKILSEGPDSGHFIVKVLPEGTAGSFFEYDKGTNQWSIAALVSDPGTKVHTVLSIPGTRQRLAGTSRGLYVQEQPLGSWKTMSGRIASLNVFDLCLDARNSRVLAGTSDGVYHAKLSALMFQKPIQTRLSPSIFCIRQSPRNSARFYAACGLGVMRSQDGGLSWAVAATGLPLRASVQELALSPCDEEHIFAATNMGLFETANGGNSWQKASDGRLSVDVPSVIFLDAQGGLVMAADNSLGGVYLSKNGGMNWERLFTSRFDAPVRRLLQDPDRASDIYLGTQYDGVYRLRLNGNLQSINPR